MAEKEAKGKKSLKERSVDPATQQMLEIAEKEGYETVWTRVDNMGGRCRLGLQGICCRICSMGPCHVRRSDKGELTGICGATVDTVVARNYIRMVASGCAAHSDHGRDVARTLFLLGEGKVGDYQIKDEKKLNALAREYGVKVEGKKPKEVARDLGEKILSEFGQQGGELRMAKRAPQKRVEIWRNLGIMPRGVDREVVELLHRSTMGVDNDYRNMLKQGMRTALADGWGGSMVASEVSDILFGSPRPVRAKANLGVLEEEEVNILVHGHEPSLAEVVAVASHDPELLELAKEKGAKGINIAGICCTANEVLMRHGISVAGNFLQQELAIMTGAVDLMMIDVQCLMPSLITAAKCFHTELITTSPKCKFPNVTHIEFEEERALEVAKEIIRHAVENYPQRAGKKVVIPKESKDMVAGFTASNVFYHLGGKYRSTYRPLNDAIMAGRLRGVVGIVGCNNPHVTHDFSHIEIAKELLKNDVLLAVTGCAAIAEAKQGLCQPEAAFEYAGEGLREVCEAVGIPPVLHFGACVDNSRILLALTEMVKEGGLGEDISDLPVAGAAPEWMSEKAITIGLYFVACGVFTVFGQPQPVTGSANLTRYLTEDVEKLVGGKFAFEPDPLKAARLMLSHLNGKRKALGLQPMMYAKKEELAAVP